MGKYGTNLEGFGAFEGGVNSQEGAPLISTQSVGEKSLLFGPAALREIQLGVANGDFGIPPIEAGSTVTESNPLPYWTFTDTSSSGAITCAVVADSTAASGSILRWTIANGTTTGKSAKISRYIPIASSANRSLVYLPEVNIKSASVMASAKIGFSFDYYDQNYTFISSGASSATNTFASVSSGKSLIDTGGTYLSAPANAAFGLLQILITTTGTNGATYTLDLAEILLHRGPSAVAIAEFNAPSTYASALLTQFDGVLTINPGSSVQLYRDTSVSGNLTVNGYQKANGSTVSTYDRGASADTTTITTAGTYYALTNADVLFTPQFVGQRWLLTYTAYASLNTTTIQHCFVRANITDSSNVIQGSELGYARADNFGTSGRGATVAFTKVWVSDTTSARKFKLYGTASTTNGLTLSLAYTQITAYPIG